MAQKMQPLPWDDSNVSWPTARHEEGCYEKKYISTYVLTVVLAREARTIDERFVALLDTRKDAMKKVHLHICLTVVVLAREARTIDR